MLGFIRFSNHQYLKMSLYKLSQQTPRDISSSEAGRYSQATKDMFKILQYLALHYIKSGEIKVNGLGEPAGTRHILSCPSFIPNQWLESHKISPKVCLYDTWGDGHEFNLTFYLEGELKNRPRALKHFSFENKSILGNIGCYIDGKPNYEIKNIFGIHTKNTRVIDRKFKQLINEVAGFI
jgi:hypothetical protein